MMETETELSKKLRMVAVGANLNTQDGDLPWVGMMIQKSQVALLIALSSDL